MEKITLRISKMAVELGWDQDDLSESIIFAVVNLNIKQANL